MGYDYKPRNATAGWYRHNIWGHSEMAMILIASGEALNVNTFWATSNDGLYIPAETCRHMAKSLRTHLHLLCMKKIMTKIGEETSYSKMKLTKEKLIKTALNIDFDGWRPLDNETKEWILEFAEWLDKCSGCWQY
jgi:hypothetical protein